mgnify:CR=1 FL=1
MVGLSQDDHALTAMFTGDIAVMTVENAFKCGIQLNFIAKTFKEDFSSA